LSWDKAVSVNVWFASLGIFVSYVVVVSGIELLDELVVVVVVLTGLSVNATAHTQG
jgi:hypothetical protein